MMIVGSTSSARTRPPTKGRGPRQAEEIEEYRQAEQTEHDRRHRGEIVDIHLDHFGQPVLRREFLKIDRGCNTERQAQCTSVTSIVISAEPTSAPLMTGKLRLAAVARREERARLNSRLTRPFSVRNIRATILRGR